MLAVCAAAVVAACTPKTETQVEPAPEADVVADETVAETLTVDVLDCGMIKVSDMDAFSSAGDYAGETYTLADTCYLIQHPNGRMIWDLGLPSGLAGAGEQTQDIFTVSLSKTITEQLAVRGIVPSEIRYVAISHDHFDHVGQADQLQGATWLVHEDEYDAMFPPADSLNQPSADLAAMYSAFVPMEAVKFRGEYDVFGDGTVVIFETPGHTPGHTSLQLTMPESGTVLLTGDLYHRAKSRELKRVPRFNFDEAGTLASMDSFEARAAQLGAKVIIQHEPADIEPLGGEIR